MWPNEGPDLQALIDTSTRPWIYIKLMIFVGEGKYVSNVNLKFLVVPCKNVYNYILIRPFAEALDMLASPVHLKLKFQNLYSELVTINVNLTRSNKIYQACNMIENKESVMQRDKSSFPHQTTKEHEHPTSHKYNKLHRPSKRLTQRATKARQKVVASPPSYV